MRAWAWAGVALWAAGCTNAAVGGSSSSSSSSSGGGTSTSSGGTVSSAQGVSSSRPATTSHGTTSSGVATSSVSVPSSGVVDAGQPLADGGTLSSSSSLAAGSSSGPGVDAGLPAACMGPNKVPPPPLPVVNGTRQPTHVPLDAAQQLAVIALSDNGPNGGGICSGTLIAPTIVLTAKHCTDGTAGNAFYVLFGMDDTAPVLAIQATQKHEHPTVDLTLLELSQTPSASITVAPIPITLEDLSDADIGITLEQAGYGYVNTNGTSNGRFFVAEPLDGFETAGDYLVVNGMNMHGVCFGDSGGPSMRISPAGDTRVVGALGYGDPSCVGRDRYTRVDHVRAWVEGFTGITPGAGPRPCGTETAAGHCNSTGSIAYWCDAAVLQQEVCAAGNVCQWQAGASQWRCGPQASDPCMGTTAFGACNGEDLSWCDLGTPRTRPCATCAERCLLVNDQVGYACKPSDCGDLTYLGRCNGTTAEWCDGTGQRTSEDCSAGGGTCGYVDPTQGYYCLPSSCGGYDYLGSCIGNVLRWCSNGHERSKDCAATSQVCRLVDAVTGYDCVTP